MADQISLKRRTRRISLAFMGEGWGTCFVEILRANYAEGERIDAISEEHTGVRGLVEALRLLFVSGQCLDASGNVVAMTAEHLDLFDADAVMEMTQQLTDGEQPDPKVGSSSPTTSPGVDQNPSDSSDSSTANDSDTPPGS